MLFTLLEFSLVLQVAFCLLETGALFYRYIAD
jgi:hypothetical protein